MCTLKPPPRNLLAQMVKDTVRNAISFQNCLITERIMNISHLIQLAVNMVILGPKCSSCECSNEYRWETHEYDDRSLEWWRHQMDTFSALLALCAHKGQGREALMFSLICTWINGWVNNREAGELRRHHAHYDVTVMDRQADRRADSHSERYFGL